MSEVNEIARSFMGLGGFVVGVLGTNEMLHFVTWTRRKAVLFNEAYNYARALNKPLLVIGRPTSIYGVHAHG